MVKNVISFEMSFMIPSQPLLFGFLFASLDMHDDSNARKPIEIFHSHAKRIEIFSAGWIHFVNVENLACCWGL